MSPDFQLQKPLQIETPSGCRVLKVKEHAVRVARLGNINYWGDVNFIRLLFGNVLDGFNNWCRWRLKIFYVSRSAWMFRWGSIFQVRWRIIKAIVRGATSVPVRRSFSLYCQICHCRRCRLERSLLLAMRNSAFVLQFIA